MAIKKALGKGLGALLINDVSEKEVSNETGFIEMDITKIEPNKEQPRKRFDDDSILELSESIKQFGILQPILVKPDGEFYIIISGERRYRAARLAKLKTIPIIIKDYTEIEMLQVALIENLQRQDLNPIEEAMSYKKLQDEFSLTQEDISKRVGKSRNSISYSINLLNLDKRVQDFLIEGKLTTGHARTLLVVKDLNSQFELSEKIIEECLSVRDTEKLIKIFLQDDVPKEKNKVEPKRYLNFESDLKSILGTKVNIVDGKNKGKIEIEYYSSEELDRILCLFKKIV